MKKERYIVLIIILGALTALGPFSIDMYLPGFPAIAKSFGITTGRVSLSLSSFFLGIALGQVLYGPLIDRFGRKKPLYAGLFLYLAASAGCYFAPSIEDLVVLRFIQAVGSCAAGVVSMAMVRDLFPVEDNAKIFSLLLLVLGASPMIAPTLGGLVSAAFGWQAIFVALFLLALVILITVYAVLPESRQPDRSHSLSARPILLGFWQVIKEPQFITYAIGGGIALSGLFAYVADSPSIFMEGYGVSNRTYGWIFALLAIGFVGLSQFNRVFSKYYKADQIVMGAVGCMAVISFLLLYGLNQGWFGIVGTAVLIFIFLGCVGIVNPNAAALSMAPFEKDAGSAASLFGLIQWGIAGLSSIVVSLFKSRTPIPLAGIMTGSAVLALLILFVGRRAIKKQVVVTPGKLEIVH
ncbi:multidrug effflux MFS transporter [Mucilaginibacter sp.]|jgi:DHA1 family bicyclomycin/chloramphenicol resistance-like MFS transporter|uniref:multidrug effflux MFS transporter n=1 Tax=Mucilaginibacter sp. TaxID=1882438 RepID=UPI0035664E76